LECNIHVIEWVGSKETTYEMTAFTIAHSYTSTSCSFCAALSKGTFGCREGALTSIHRSVK